MTLFGTEDQASTSTLVIVAGMVVTALGAFGTTLLSFLSTRAKLQFDAEVALLKSSHMELQKSHAKCEDDHRETQSRLTRVNERCEKAEHAAAKMEGELAGANRELTSLRVDFNQLREMFFKSNGKDGVK